MSQQVAWEMEVEENKHEWFERIGSRLGLVGGLLIMR